MRSLLRAFSRLLLSGVSAFVFAALLVSPRMALAETVNITEGAGSVVMSEFANITGSGLTPSDYNSGWSTNSCVAFMVDKASYSEFERATTSPAETVGTGWSFDVGIRGDLAGYQTNSNNALVLTYTFGNAAIRSNERFRVVTPSKYMTVTGASDATSTLTLYHVFIGNSQSNMHEVTLSSGYYVADLNVTCIALVFSASNRSSSLLRYDHTNWIHSIPQVITFMEDESIRNQTEQLMSTDGSSDLVGDVTDGGTTQVQQLPIAQVVTQMSGQFDGILNENEADGTIPFPGLSFQGFVIPATNIDVVSMVPADIMAMIRNAVTLVFVIMFVHHIINLFHAIFGIYEYGDMDAHTYSPQYTIGHVTPSYTSVDMDEELGF